MLQRNILCKTKFLNATQSTHSNDEQYNMRKGLDGNLTLIVIQSIYNKINGTRNLLIAPHQIAKVVNSFNTQINEPHQKLPNEEKSDENMRSTVATAILTDEYTNLTAHLIVNNSIKTYSFEELNATAVSKASQQMRHGSSLNIANRIKIVNSVTLEAGWTINFHRRETRKRLFFSGHPKRVYVNAMRKDDVFNFAKLVEFNANALELSMQRDEYKMLILLPNEINGLPKLLENIRSNFSSIKDLNEKVLRPTLVRVSLPKFQINHKFILNEEFEEIFNSSTTTIVQNTIIKLSEDGIGNFHDKKVLFWNAHSSVRITPEIFDVSHPFAFIIRDKDYIQFIGIIAHLH